MPMTLQARCGSYPTGGVSVIWPLIIVYEGCERKGRRLCGIKSGVYIYINP